MRISLASRWPWTVLALVLATLILIAAPMPVRAAEEFVRAQQLVEAGRWKEALPLLDTAIAAEPDRAAAHLLRGIVRVELKQWDPALSDYEFALRLDPNNAEAWYRRGYWWAADAKDRKALADYDRAIRLDPGNARYRYARATAYERLRDWRRAAQAYREVLEVDPSHANAARDLEEMLAKLEPSAPSVPASTGASDSAAVATASPSAPHPIASVPVQVERDDPSRGSGVVAAGDEPAAVLTRVLAAQARGDLAALEREWNLDALGAEAASLQRARLRAVAASVRIDEFRMRERATMFSEDGSHAMVRAEVSFRATHASGVSHWANGVLGVLRRTGTDADAAWVVVGVVPDELLNSELAERADQQAGRAPAGDPAHLQPANAHARNGSGAGLLASGVLVASLAAGPQAGGGEYARPITYATLNRDLDAAMNREYGLSKLKFVANGLNTQIGQIPGAGDLVSFVYQISDTAANSMEVLGETMKHGFTRIGALKATQVFAGVVQLASELVPPADVASDLFQYRLEAITANAEIRRTIYHLKLDLESGRLKPAGARLRLAEGRTYPPGVRISVENAENALLDPSNPNSVRVSYEGGLVGVVVATPELLRIEAPRLPFEVVAQVIINPGLVRYEAFDERAAKVLGAVQRGSNWVIPVLLGRQAVADASTGAPVLADFQRMRLQLERGVHPDSAASWAWQPCRGTQRLAVRLDDGSSTLPVAVRNNFLNQLRDLVVVDAQGKRLQRIALGTGESLTDLKLVGIDASGSNVNLTALVRRQLACVAISAPDPAVVTARANMQAFSITAAGPGNTQLGLRVGGDAETSDLVLELPIIVTGATGGWRLVEVQRNDFQTPVILNHRQKPTFSDTGLTVTCGAKVTLPQPDTPAAEWPQVGYDAEVRVHWGAMPDSLVVGQTVRVAASVSRRFEPTSGWFGDPPPAYVRTIVPGAAEVKGEAGGEASASFLVPPPRAGETLGISFSAGGCSSYSQRVFVYRPANE
jgi:tetratricopeptide (TPR) repeat protein